MKRLGPAGLVMVLLIAGALPAAAAGLSLVSGGVALYQRDYGGPLSCSLPAIADTYVRSDQSSNSFGSAATLEVHNSSAATRRSLLRFNLAACSPAIPADAIVHSATLRLTAASVLSVGPRTYGLRRALDEWSEATSWSTQPVAAGTLSATASIPLSMLVGTPVEWSLTADVQSFVGDLGANHGWQLADTQEGVTPLLAEGMSFGSREAASGQPLLTVVYAP